jgi:hypothetical protein
MGGILGVVFSNYVKAAAAAANANINFLTSIVTFAPTISRSTYSTNFSTAKISEDGLSIYLSGLSGTGASTNSGQQTLIKLNSLQGTPTLAWGKVQPISTPSKRSNTNIISDISIGKDGNVLSVAAFWKNDTTLTTSSYISKQSSVSGDVLKANIFANIFATGLYVNNPTVWEKTDGNIFLAGNTVAGRACIELVPTSTGFTTVSAKIWNRANLTQGLTGGWYVYGDAISTGKWSTGSRYFSTITDVAPPGLSGGSGLVCCVFTAANTLSWAGIVTHSSSFGMTVSGNYSSYIESTIPNTDGSVYIAGNTQYNDSDLYIAKINNSGIVWQNIYRHSSSGVSMTLSGWTLDGMGNLIIVTRPGNGYNNTTYTIFSINLSDRSINWQRDYGWVGYVSDAVYTKAIKAYVSNVAGSSYFIIPISSISAGDYAYVSILPSNGNLPNTRILDPGTGSQLVYQPSSNITSVSTNYLTYISDTNNWSSTTLTYTNANVFLKADTDPIQDFTGNTTVSVVLAANITSYNIASNVQYLMVAGGGGGGSCLGGGGGGGGVLNNYISNVTSNTTYTITIGAGGQGSTGTLSGPQAGADSSNGGNTIIAGGGILLNAVGGGSSAQTPIRTGNAPGRDGGGGGGGSGRYPVGPGVNGGGGSIASGGGNGGGSGGGQDPAAPFPMTERVSGGGGGGGWLPTDSIGFGRSGASGGAGAPAFYTGSTTVYQGGNGGDGYPTFIYGSNVYLAGGGGGAGWLANTTNAYGHGGGGTGGLGGGGMSGDGAGNATTKNGISGLFATGGGGGGGGQIWTTPTNNISSGYGGSGGSGVVIFAHPTTYVQANVTGSNVTIGINPAGQFVYTFYNSGTIKF